ncbi:MAG: hypothetical protein RID53_07345 [Coleofasciculus sp. B1-GNL1-01]|uniref:hypothetical protein n=1 Tax=Coleofasciculus sp. B1-GNL1-01 TaxID=3068484 RepID=UPI0032F488EB
MTEKKKINKPSAQDLENEVKGMQERGITNAEVLQAMAVIADKQGDTTLARKLANTAEELVKESQV